MRTAEEEAKLVDLLKHLNLTSVKAYEHSGARREATERDPEESDQILLSAKVRQTDRELETRFKLDVIADQFAGVADIGIIYTKSEPAEVTGELLTGFMEEVAVMAAYPFLRESIFTSASRLDVNRPVLGVLRRGDARFDSLDSP